MALNAPDPSFVKLEVFQLNRADKDRICWENAAALMG